MTSGAPVSTSVWPEPTHVTSSHLGQCNETTAHTRVRTAPICQSCESLAESDSENIYSLSIFAKSCLICSHSVSAWVLSGERNPTVIWTRQVLFNGLFNLTEDCRKEELRVKEYRELQRTWEKLIQAPALEKPPAQHDTYYIPPWSPPSGFPASVVSTWWKRWCWAARLSQLCSETSSDILNQSWWEYLNSGSHQMVQMRA